MFMNCTFFGHRDAPSNIKSNLEREIMSLSDKGVKHFYVGNNGNFDFLVQTTLNKLANQNPNLKYSGACSVVPCQPLFLNACYLCFS